MGKGKCYLCNSIYSDRGIARHIGTCIETLTEINRSRTNEGMYLIKVNDKYDSGYYLYLLIDTCVSLYELDQYLRNIWLECCGHLSGFTIDGIHYESYPDNGWRKVEDMNFTLHEVLLPGMSFSYIYDYGSSTELNLKVMEKYKHTFGDEGIYLIGRNMPREYECDYCKNIARYQYEDAFSGEVGLVCDDCMKKLEKEREEVYFSDVINSPRAGVCGYDGPAEDIRFMKHKKTEKGKRKNKWGQA